MKIGIPCATLLTFLLAACAAPTPREPLQGHINAADTQASAPSASIPSPVQQTLALPKPRPQAKAETYSVVVNNVPVSDLLFALARDAKVNVDIHPGITGTVSLNAIDQTLPQLLTRIAKQVDMRFELDGPNLAVMPDTPFLKNYKVDYVNMSRNVSGTISTNTQIPSGSTVTGGGGASVGGGAAGNVSNTKIENASKNQFWEMLEKNVKDILHETDKIMPADSTSGESAGEARNNAQGQGAANGDATAGRVAFREAASVIINPGSGVVTVRATQRQHERIQEFLDRVINSARRQVLIEATVVEVKLNNNYAQGIDWTQFSGNGLNFVGRNPATATSNLIFNKNGSPGAVISLLESFGTTKVLSSPRISVLNNQTALLKVVDNYVYFNVQATIAPPTNNSSAVVAYTTTPQTVSVGLVMPVTAQISDNDTVILNIRPSITSVAAWVKDPNPSLTISNLVPQIRTREIESVMRVASGNTAVLGGLMVDSIDYENQRIPIIGQIPLLGEIVNGRDNTATKTELVIFLRPVVIKDASLEGDYAAMRAFQPDQRFFDQPNEAQPFNIQPTP